MLSISEVVLKDGTCMTTHKRTCLQDEDTVLNGTLNGAGLRPKSSMPTVLHLSFDGLCRPGTISGRAMQGGLKWGGFFEARRLSAGLGLA